MRVLVVEDDEVIAQQLIHALSREGFDVDHAADGEAAVGETILRSYSLIVLDIMLPKLDGWQVCREVRENGFSAPILMLTARDTVDDRVRGLEEGADDYLPKPFDVRELLARVRALLRRDQAVKTGIIKVADLEIDSRARIVRRAGREISLTPREFSLLEALARNEGRTLTREMILENVWNSEENLENSVNYHVTSLRKKIDAPFENKLIQTVHGFGYSLRGGMANT